MLWRSCIDSYYEPTLNRLAVDQYCPGKGFVLIPSYSNGIFNFTSQADADLLGNCTVIYGDVLISGDEITAINLPGINTILETLSAYSCNNLSNISAPLLAVIEGNVILSSLPHLKALTSLRLKGLIGVYSLVIYQ